MVSALFTFGRFTFLDLADLNWEKELELVRLAVSLGACSCGGPLSSTTSFRQRWKSG